MGEALRKERIIWLDLLKLFAIFLVIWGHLFPRLGWPWEQKYMGIDGLIYSFHMPLFMTISGYVSSKVISGQGDLFRKFRQLIIPCALLGIICSCIKFQENFWYLKSLFSCYCLFLLFYKLFHNRLISYFFLVGGCFVLFPLIAYLPVIGSFKLDFMLPFFGLGLLLRKYSLWISKHLIPLTIILGIMFFICESFWNGQYVWYNTQPRWVDYKHLYLNHQFVFDTTNLVICLFRYFTGAVASCFFIFLFQKLFPQNQIGEKIQYVSKWGGKL